MSNDTHEALVARIREITTWTTIFARLPEPVKGHCRDRRSKSWRHQDEIEAGIYEITAGPWGWVEQRVEPDAFELKIAKRGSYDTVFVLFRHGKVERTGPTDKADRPDTWAEFFNALVLSDTGRDFAEAQGIGEHNLSKVIGKLIDSGALSRGDFATACEELREEFRAEV